MACMLKMLLLKIVLNGCLLVATHASFKRPHLVQSAGNFHSKDFWTKENIEKAMANEEEIIVSNNDFLSTTNRKRRSTDDNFWTPEKIAEVNDDMPEPGQEYFDRFGIQPINEVQLLSNDGEDNVKIKPADLGIEPWKHFGKLFYKYKRRFGYCSAAFVDRQVLITAAHCIKHTDSWHTNFHFYHRYNTDVNPGTPVNVHKVFIPRKYDIKSPFPYGDLRYDYAFITTYNSSKDGFLGTKFGFSASLLSSGGYSQQPPYNGTKLVFIEGPKGPEESTFVHFPLNGMKKGSSGGPWLMKESGKFYVVGLNSHRRQYSLAMISPKVDRTALELLEYASKQVIPEKKISTDLTCEPAKCALMCGNNRYEAKCTTRDDGCECTCKCLRG